VSRHLILALEAAVAIDVGAEYRGELAFDPRLTSQERSLQARLATIVIKPLGKRFIL